MASDELPTGDPLMFNTFSGNDVPVDAYNLLTEEEAHKRLTDNDKTEYLQDPTFGLILRSRIWDELKSSVCERREMYKERLKLRQLQETKNNDNQPPTPPTPPTNNSNDDIIISDIIQPENDRNESVFANPFTPDPLHNINHKNYAIPYDNNDNIVYNEVDDIWANGNVFPFGQDDTNNELTDQHVNNDSNDSIQANNKLSKVRKSEIFLDPFHWDTDDENNHHDDIDDDYDDYDENDENKCRRVSMFEIDVNVPFKDPFHCTQNNNDMDIKNEDKLFANPFDENEIKCEDICQENDKQNEDLLRLLFGDDVQDNAYEQQYSFANPFHSQPQLQQNDSKIMLSPMLKIIEIDNDKLPPIIHLVNNQSNHVLTPVPHTEKAKRSSAVMDIDETMLAASFDEQLETEYNFPDIQTEVVNKESISEKGDVEEKKNENNNETVTIVTQPAVKKKSSLSFSWSDKSHDSLYEVVRRPTPPPRKTMNEELYELLAQLLEKTIQKPRAHYMVEGVPWEKWKCFDWPTHVKQPETLKQVRDLLDDNQYDTPGQFAENVRNVFRNYTTYHWKGVGQYRVNTKAGILWEEFNIEYFQVLHDESEERKRDESRKRAIDEAKENNDPREHDFSNTHTPTDAEDHEEEEVETQESGRDKKISFVVDDMDKDKDVPDDDEEFAAMAKMHFEMSLNLSTRPNTPAYTPQPPPMDFHDQIDLNLEFAELPAAGFPLETLLSGHTLFDTDVGAITMMKRNQSNGLDVLNQAEISRSRKITPPIRKSSNASSVGAVSVNSRNVRFQNPQQAQRALKVSNVLHNIHREESLTRTNSHSSISSIFRKNKAKNIGSALLAKIAKNVPIGWDPKRRRGSIIHVRQGTSPSSLTITNGTNEQITLHGLGLQSRASEPIDSGTGKRHRESKELIDENNIVKPRFVPQQYSLDENIPEPHSSLIYYCLIVLCLCVIMIVFIINYRLFSDEENAFLYPMKNIGSRIISVFSEPLFIICVIGIMIVIHMQYRPHLFIENKRLFIIIFVIGNILNIVRVVVSSCSMDFIYNLYIYLMIISTMIVPFFSFDEKWKETETIFILFIFWIGVILLGFILLILHQYFSIFILIMFYTILIAWIIRFFYYKSLGIFDNTGNLSSKYDIGYCSLLIPATLLLPQLGAAIIIQISNNNKSLIYFYFLLLKLTFIITRWLWESTALRGTDEVRYIHLMFPIFLIEELLDTILLIKLQFSSEIIGLLILMAVNHIVRDSDIGYRILYKKYFIPFVLQTYYGYYHKSESMKELRTLRSLSTQPNDLNINVEEANQQIELGINIIINEEEDAYKELNLAQEGDDIHLARMILHFQMFRFVEFVSRFAILLLLIIDIICDSINIGNRLLLNVGNRGFLILLCFVSMIIIFVTNLISQQILSKQALTSIQFLDKIELINDFSYKDRLYIHLWIIFGDECKIFKRFWIFFAFVMGYYLIVILQAFFSTNGLVSICHVFF